VLWACPTESDHLSQDFTSDVKYHISSDGRVSQGTINVQGYAKANFLQGMPAFYTNENPSVAGAVHPVGFSNGAILAMAIIASGIVLLFWWFAKRGFSK
jgi:hypothetical protein